MNVHFVPTAMDKRGGNLATHNQTAFGAPIDMRESCDLN
jgi:hypothetical protein